MSNSNEHTLFTLWSTTDKPGRSMIFNSLYKQSVEFSENIGLQNVLHKEKLESFMIRSLLGKIGSGKTHLSKKIILQARANNSKIYIFDPENEYGALTKKLGGEVIEFGSKNNFINPLQIFSFDEGNTFKRHLNFISNLLEFIQPNIKNDIIIKSHLLSIIELTYKKFKINEATNFSKIKNNDFPIFSDVQKAGKTYLSSSNIKKQLSSENLQKITLILNDLSKGNYSYFLNNKTTINFKNDFITFSLRGIFTLKTKELSDIVMYILLRYTSSEAIKNYTKNQNQKLVILVDEAHTFISDENKIALQFLYNWTKRIRKCNGAVIITTQDIKDMQTSTSGGRQSTGILNNMQYVFYGQFKEDNINSLIEMYKNSGGINTQIIQNISKANVGEFYMEVSKNENYLIKIVQTPYEKELFERRNN